jgi:hypothetical protein
MGDRVVSSAWMALVSSRIQALAPLVGVPEQRRIDGQGKRPGAHLLL